MSLKERIESLRSKHQALEEEVGVESHRPSPDAEVIARLKREKLKIKDEITRLSEAVA